MASFHVLAGADDHLVRPAIRKISLSDVFDALRLGWRDFARKPSHYVFLCLMYPVAGFFLAAWSAGADMLPVIYPLVTGFALLGPFAALGLYEISRRNEQGLDDSWRHALDFLDSPALPSILAVGILLLGLFTGWLIVAQLIYTGYFGDMSTPSLSVFLSEIFTTPQGWQVILWGNLIGLLFAVVVLATTVVTFPLLIDRDVGAGPAVDASIRATIANPVPVGLWGLIVAVMLFAGAVPIFAGLAVVMPVLGHATWHLYRKLVVFEA